MTHVAGPSRFELRTTSSEGVPYK